MWQVQAFETWVIVSFILPPPQLRKLHSWQVQPRRHSSSSLQFLGSATFPIWPPEFIIPSHLIHFLLHKLCSRQVQLRCLGLPSSMQLLYERSTTLDRAAWKHSAPNQTLGQRFHIIRGKLRWSSATMATKYAIHRTQVSPHEKWLLRGRRTRVLARGGGSLENRVV